MSATRPKRFLDICVIGLPFSGRSEIVEKVEKDLGFQQLRQIASFEEKNQTIRDKDYIYNNLPNSSLTLLSLEHNSMKRGSQLIFFILETTLEDLITRSKSKYSLEECFKMHNNFEKHKKYMIDLLIDNHVVFIDKSYAKPSDTINIVLSNIYRIVEERDCDFI